MYRQASATPGMVGFSLCGDLPRLEFHTLSAWEDDASLRAFVRAAQHRAVTERFSDAMREPSLFVRFAVRGSALPLRWEDALARQGERLAARAA